MFAAQITDRSLWDRGNRGAGPRSQGMYKLDGARGSSDETTRGSGGAAPGKRTRTEAIQRRTVPGAGQRLQPGEGDPPSLTFRGVVLTAASGETEFRKVEDKLTLAELKELRRIAEEGVMGVVALLAREAQRAGLSIDDEATAAGRQVAEAYVAWVTPQADVGAWTAALEELEAQTAPATLPAATIGQLRVKVAMLPPSLRGRWYQLLQDKVIYDNQRDNVSSLEEADGGTCNLTSVSMGLEGMGFDTDPDSLITSVLDEHPADDTRTEQAKRIEGTGMREAVELTSGDALTTWRCSDAAVTTEAFWTGTVRTLLACGHSVFLGARGHVIRVQSVGDDAVTVDDPYGAWSFTSDAWQTRNDRPGDGVSGVASAGENSVWSFTDGALSEVIWVRFMGPRELPGTELSHHLAIAPVKTGKVTIAGATFVID